MHAKCLNKASIFVYHDLFDVLASNHFEALKSANFCPLVPFCTNTTFYSMYTLSSKSPAKNADFTFFAKNCSVIERNVLTMMDFETIGEALVKFNPLFLGNLDWYLSMDLSALTFFP